MRRWPRAAYVVGVLALVLVGAELFQLWIEPGPAAYFMFPPNTERVIRLDPAVFHGLRPQASFTVNRYGLRGEAPSKDDGRRILALGGSTVECLAQDDDRSWVALLEGLMNAARPQRHTWIGNARRSGITSFENIIQLRHLPDMLPPFDTVVLLAGANDLAFGYTRANAPERPAADEAERYDRTFFSIVRPGARLPFNLALYRLYLSVKRVWSFSKRGVLQGAGESESYTAWIRTTRAEREAARPHIDALPDLNPYLATYRANLRSIVDMAAARNLKLVFVTQPLMYRPNQTAQEEAIYGSFGKASGYTSGEKSSYYSSAAVARMIDLYNSAMLDVCKARDVPCIDAARELEPRLENYYDGMHLTDAGNERLARIVFQGLVRTGVAGGS